MKRKLLLMSLLVGAVAFAQQVVNQGRPGTQGCWPVCATGTIVVIGPDGGAVPVNITQSIPLHVFMDGGQHVIADQGAPAASPWACYVAMDGGQQIIANQGTSPWVTNVSQFGGNAVVTGTGVSGLGIPRMTVSSDSSLTCNQGTSPWTENVAQWGGVATSLGQKVKASSVPVVLPSDQTIAVSLVLDGGQTIEVTQGTNPWACYVTMDGGQHVIADQGTNPWDVNVDQWGGTATTLGQKTKAASVPVVLPSDQIVDVSLTLDGGQTIQVTQGTNPWACYVAMDGGQHVIADQGTTPWDVNVSQWGGTATTLGQKTKAASVPVVLPSDQTISTALSLDGGQSIGTFPINCGTVAHDVVSVTSGGAVNFPAAQLAGRVYIELCNSQEGLPHDAKIRVDGVAPVNGVANKGDVLSRGDCKTYAISSAVTPKVIGSNVPATTVTSYECAP